MLASALSINSMLFFLGGSLGTAVFMAMVNTRSGGDLRPLNPLNSSAGASIAFSDAFLILAAPVIVAMALSLTMASARRPAEMQPPTPALAEAIPVEAAPIIQWLPDCSVPWMPECSEFAAGEPQEVVAAAGTG